MNRKVALVTGGGSKIGHAIAMSLLDTGAQVIVTSRNRTNIEPLLVSQSIHPIYVDLTSKNAAELIFKQISKVTAKVDILVNNAAIGSTLKSSLTHEFDPEVWDRTIEINLKIPFLLASKLLPAMLKNGFGRIINISSVAAKLGCIHGVAYAASKQGIIGLTRTIAVEYFGKNITCNAICPGPVDTAGNDSRLQYDASRLKVTTAAILENLPLKRRATPVEIARAVTFLANEDSQSINGQTLNICGGLRFD